jgi:hypothetical protein
MPTTLPPRAVAAKADDGLASFCRALLLFYSVLALNLLTLSAIEVYLGIYPGLTGATAILKAAGTSFFASEFPAVPW